MNCWLRIVAQIRAVRPAKIHEEVMPRFEIHRASDTELRLEAFHIRELRHGLSSEPKVKRFFEGMSFAYSGVRQSHRVRRSGRIYAIPECPAIGAREQSVPEGLVHEQTLSGGLDEYPSG